MSPRRPRRATSGEDRPAGSAVAAAMRLLGRRDHFRAELAAALERKGFTPDETAAAVERCAELGLVDDQRVAGRFAELRAAERGWGPRRLEAELLRRGASADVASASSRLAPARLAAALQVALRRAETRQPSGWFRLGAARARLVSSLIRRGFDPDDAREAVADLAADREGEDHALDDWA